MGPSDLLSKGAIKTSSNLFIIERDKESFRAEKCYFTINYHNFMYVYTNLNIFTDPYLVIYMLLILTYKV